MANSSAVSRLGPFAFTFLVAAVIASGHTPPAFSLQDADGKVHSSAELAQHKATVFLFLATDCPNSNSYAPELGRIYAEYQSRGFAFYSVYSDPAETSAGVKEHDRQYALPFPALLDAHQVLARNTGARVTPEAVVVSSAGETLYRGRIDDRFANYGQTRLHVEQHELRAALDQILAGKPVANPDAPSLGCAIPGVSE